MGRGAPNKKGLVYFPKMIDFYEDDKIFDLLDRYGPLGVTVYDCILCIVYKHGYYAEIPLDKLSMMIIKMIGNKWVKSKKTVVQVVHFCSEIGLLNDDLMTENIITSVGIQRRYYEIAVKRMKRQLYTDKYWLLGTAGDEEPLLNSPKNAIPSEEKRINSEEIQNNPEESTTKIKEKENIYNTAFQPPELERAFQLYLSVREHNFGEVIPEQVQALREDLLSLSNDTVEQLAIIKKATAGGWKSFYKSKEKSGKKTQEKKDTRQKGSKFSNFQERSYDMADLESRLVERGEQ